MSKQTSIPQPAALAIAIMVMATITSWVSAIVAHLLGRPKPYTWPYYEVSVGGNNDTHEDLLGFTSEFRHFHTSHFFTATPLPFTYPPAVALVYRFFLPDLQRPATTFTAFVVAIAITAAFLFTIRLRSYGVGGLKASAFVGSLLVFSSVLPFELNRLNTEIVVFVFIAAFLWAFVSRKHSLAGALLGGAIAMKLYPFILLGALLTAKRFKSIAVAIGVAGALTLTGLIAETRSVSLSLRGTQQGLRFFADHFVTQVHVAIGWDHSIFATVKRGLVHYFGRPDLHDVYIIYVIAAALTSLILYVVRVRELPVLNELASLVIILITIPPVSYEYTLLHLFSIFALFCCWCIRNTNVSKRLSVQGIAICFGVSFAVLGLL